MVKERLFIVVFIISSIFSSTRGLATGKSDWRLEKKEDSDVQVFGKDSQRKQWY